MAKVSKCLEASAAGQLAVTTDVKTSIEHSITSDGVLSQLGVEFRCSEIKGAKDAFLVKACASKESRLFAAAKLSSRRISRNVLDQWKDVELSSPAAADRLEDQVCL